MLPPLSNLWAYQPPLNATAYQIFHEFLQQAYQRSLAGKAAPVITVDADDSVAPVKVDVRV